MERSSVCVGEHEKGERKISFFINMFAKTKLKGEREEGKKKRRRGKVELIF